MNKASNNLLAGNCKEEFGMFASKVQAFVDELEM